MPKKTMNGQRIIDGLKETLRIASCAHAAVLPFHEPPSRLRWHCPVCGGTFTQHPHRDSAQESGDA